MKNSFTIGRLGIARTTAEGVASDGFAYSFRCHSLYYEMNPFRKLGFNGLGVEFTGGQRILPLDTINNAVYNRIDKIRVYSLRLSESIWMSKRRNLSFQAIVKPGYMTHWTMIDTLTVDGPKPVAQYNNSFSLEAAVGVRFTFYVYSLYVEMGKDLLDQRRSFFRAGLGLNMYRYFR